MNDYIKNNSNRYKNCNKKLNCSCDRFQSYNRNTFGQNIKLCSPITCKVNQKCNNSNYQFQKYVLNQQNLYALMRRRPELFPIITSVKEISLSLREQRAYSNLWYRQFGTSQALPANDNWGGFYLPGSEVPYTN
jgi:hypothetical protein